ncbi:succinate dehydrogenase [ubiquinone] cytochrome b small subunit, mitochondrial isoform X1 [Octopus sinensis]|uniref:Succinate dehydrogenase [ubiquinone] cytochrome b small subunit n=1 Tax=Octopus sinensis TaxID=2607531 RepID=A0A7E6FRU6_9MOLL|nr:succinate dehydrogenase [ubiquinone] cytochrome b small subunit, mitochondrial isoform X1 [Octopus sinensis]
MAMSLLRGCIRAKWSGTLQQNNERFTGLTCNNRALYPKTLQPHLLAAKQIGFPSLSQKTLMLTSTNSAWWDYFRPRLGPFTPAEKKGKHMMLASTHWKLERIVAISLLGTLPAAIISPNSVTDFLLVTSFLLHSHWGIDSILQDYVAKYIPWIQKVWLLVSILAMAGLLHFNYNDIGASRALLLLWSIH